jgi:hydrogenase maturation factor
VTSTSGAEARQAVPGHCITCSDEAIEMTVLSVDADAELARCQAAGGEGETVDVALVSPVRPADRLLVHAGTAIALQGAD